MLEGTPSPVAAVIGIRQLCGDEDLTAVEAAGLQPLVDARLVAIGGRGVDQPVAGFECRSDRLGRVLGRHLEDAEAELGDAISVVQVRVGDRCRLSCHTHRLPCDRGRESCRPDGVAWKA